MTLCLLTFVELHLLLEREGEELFGEPHHLLLEAGGDGMVNDLKEPLCATCFSNGLGTFLHPIWLSGQKVTKVNNWGRLLGGHSE